MSAGAFDLVVIDEATQCSITNLLPLLYRGKRLAVIGDEEQLRAINIINKSEENLLAKKYDVEEWIDDYGHYSEKYGPNKKDVYTVGVNSLPVGLADVVYLREHYRSHPQIIGFSNHRIYKKRLELKRPVDSFNENDGMHVIQVSGTAEMDPKQKSWINKDEAEKIVESIAEEPRILERKQSVGVVTPYKAQKLLIQEMLQKRCPEIDVLVGSVYTFQGDEKDIVFFSPVVAKNITDNAFNFVGNQNLINVAITRAKNSLL